MNNDFKKIVNDIKQIKIQGAINIAKSAFYALNDLIIKYIDKKTKKEDLLNILKLNKEKLIKTRPTEPAMRNILNIYEKKIQLLKNIDKNSIKKTVKEIENIFKEEEKIAIYGANLIEDGMNIFTHCHSSTVIKILKLACKQGKKFNVYNTEARPKYQGRMTAKELSNTGIKVYHTIDNAAHFFMRKCDLFLFGADAIDSLGFVYNKIGTYIYCKIAQEYNIKKIVCSSYLKYDIATKNNNQEIIEKRSEKEVWDKIPKNVKIFNPAFDSIPSNLIDGIVCEDGILSLSEFITNSEKKLFI